MQRTGARGSRRLQISSLALALVTSACVHARDFKSPEGRLLDNTAYALQQREMRTDFGLVGTEFNNFGAHLGLSYGAHKYFQLGTNFAHNAFSVFNLNFKSNVVDHRWVGVGLETGVSYMNPRLIWVLPKEYRDAFGDINVFSVPIRAITTIPAADWMDVSMGLAYQHVSLVGEVSAGDGFGEGSFGRRAFDLEPLLNFYLGRRVVLSFGGRWSMYSAWYTDLIAEVAVDEGVSVGVRSAEWVSRGPLFNNTFWASVEFRMGKYTNLRVSTTYRLLGDNFPVQVLPAIELYWRFGV